MTRPLIAIDIDDTLADSTELIRLNVNNRYNVSISKEAYRSEGEYWGYYERVWAEHGIADLTLENFFDDEMVSEIMEVPLLPSALFAIKVLHKTFDIVLITSRRKERAAQTKKWVETSFGGITIDVHFSEAHKDESKMTKGQICTALGARYLIDDNVGHCESAINEGVTPLLFGEYGWQGSAPDTLFRCRDWPSVLDYFARI
ncbi:MAG: hypothetical protein ABIQ64_03265 [Candidatus Saccharimonadales bacterium]